MNYKLISALYVLNIFISFTSKIICFLIPLVFKKVYENDSIIMLNSNFIKVSIFLTILKVIYFYNFFSFGLYLSLICLKILENFKKIVIRVVIFALIFDFMVNLIFKIMNCLILIKSYQCIGINNNTNLNSSVYSYDCFNLNNLTDLNISHELSNDLYLEKNEYTSLAILDLGVYIIFWIIIFTITHVLRQMALEIKICCQKRNEDENKFRYNHQGVEMIRISNDII